MRALVVCDGVTVPVDLEREAWTVRDELWSSGADKNVHLFGEHRGQTILSSIVDLYFDLIQIASYVYAADQQLPRGGIRRDVYGKQFRRTITLCLPVNNPEFWSRPEIIAPLRDALQFATDDQWFLRFAATPGGDEKRQLPILKGEEESSLLGRPDCVALFSGGADSLCAVIAAVEQGRRPLLVSHSSALPTPRDNDVS
jgi:hypothetical protein